MALLDRLKLASSILFLVSILNIFAISWFVWHPTTALSNTGFLFGMSARYLFWPTFFIGLAMAVAVVLILEPETVNGKGVA